MKVGDGTPGPGRPKGSQNKLTKTVKEAVEAAFKDLQDDAQANLPTWARENTTEFYKIAAKLIPSELNANVTGNLTGILAGLGKAGGREDDPPVA